MSKDDVYFGQSGNEPEQDASWAANRIAQLEAELAKAREENERLKAELKTATLKLSIIKEDLLGELRHTQKFGKREIG